jgi:ankyrin repeat protein
MKPKTTAKKTGTHPNERLCDAAKKGNLDLTLLDTLIAKGANVDEVFSGGNTALHYAAGFGHAEVVKSLLARKANIDVLNEIGLTAFARACGDGEEKVVQAFLENGEWMLLIRFSIMAIQLFTMLL